MNVKKLYVTPKVLSEEVNIGVFGCYGSTGHHGDGNKHRHRWLNWYWWHK